MLYQMDKTFRLYIPGEDLQSVKSLDGLEFGDVCKSLRRARDLGAGQVIK